MATHQFNSNYIELRKGRVVPRCTSCKYYSHSITLEPCSSCWPRVYMGEGNPGFEAPNKENIEFISNWSEEVGAG